MSDKRVFLTHRNMESRLIYDESYIDNTNLAKYINFLALLL